MILSQDDTKGALGNLKRRNCDILVLKAPKDPNLLLESPLDHDKLYEARAVSIVFLCSTEKGINDY